MTYYQTLNVTPTANIKEIKRAYYNLALATHPDKVPLDQKTEAEEKFKLISEAYEVLSDTQQRSDYDAALSSNTTFAPQQTRTTDDFRAVFKGMASDIFANYDVSQEQLELLNSLSYGWLATKWSLAWRYHQFKTDKARFRDSFKLDKDVADWHNIANEAAILLRVFKNEIFLNDFHPSIQIEESLIKSVIEFTPHNIKHILPLPVGASTLADACNRDPALVQYVSNDTLIAVYACDNYSRRMQLPSKITAGLTDAQKSDTELILHIFKGLGLKDNIHAIFSEEQIQLGLEKLRANPSAFKTICCVELIKLFATKSELIHLLEEGDFSFENLSANDQNDCDMLLAALQGTQKEKSIHTGNYGYTAYKKLLKHAPRAVILQLVRLYDNFDRDFNWGDNDPDIKAAMNSRRKNDTIRQINEGTLDFNLLHYAQKSDIDIALAAYKKDPLNIQSAPVYVINDLISKHEVKWEDIHTLLALGLLSSSSDSWEHKDNQDFVYALYQNKASDIEKASDNVVIKLIGEKKVVFSATSTAQKNNADIVHAAYEINPVNIQLAGNDAIIKLIKNNTVQLKIILNNLSEQQLKEPTIVLACAEQAQDVQDIEVIKNHLAKLYWLDEIKLKQIPEAMQKSSTIVKLTQEKNQTQYQYGETHSHNRFHAMKAKTKNFKNLAPIYQGSQGDHLKRRIFDDFAKKIRATESKEVLKALIIQLKSTDEYQVLLKKQGLTSLFFGLKTSSIKAFEALVDVQSRHLDHQVHLKMK